MQEAPLERDTLCPGGLGFPKWPFLFPDSTLTLFPNSHSGIVLDWAYLAQIMIPPSTSLVGEPRASASVASGPTHDASRLQARGLTSRFSRSYVVPVITLTKASC